MRGPMLLALLLAGSGCAGTPVAPTPEVAPTQPAPAEPRGEANGETDGQSRKLALLVGINDYGKSPGVPADQQWGKLSGTHNDVAAMEDVLSRQGFEVVKLLDSAATKQGIMDAFRSHLGQGHSDDVVVFYYSGHGQQVTDSETDPDEVDGYDEALVPWDNLGTRNGGNHLLDDDLRTLIGELASDNAVIIVDACNSGSVTRGDLKVRGGEPSGEPAASRGAEADDGGLLPVATSGPRGYVMLAAARSEEPAVEQKYTLEDGSVQSHGALTYQLVRELNRADPSTTWRQVADRMRSQLKRMNLTQQPQVEGDVRKTLFSGQWGSSEGLWRGTFVANTVKVEAGSWHGIEVGDRLEIHAAGGSEPLATARVNLVDLGTSSARLEEGQALPAEVQQGALDVRLLQPNLAAYTPRLDVAKAPKDVARELGKLAEAKGITVISDRKVQSRLQPGDLVLVEQDGQLSLQREGGDAVGIPLGCGQEPEDAVPANGAGVAQVLDDAIELDRVRTRLAALDNVVASTDLAVRLDVHRVDARWDDASRTVVVDADHGPLAGTRGDPALAPGETFQLRVVNDSKQAVYVAILELGADGGIELLFPFPETARDQTLVPAGKTLPIEPLSADEHGGTVAWKLIATESYVDFVALEHRVECREELATRGDQKSQEDSALSQVFSDYAVTTRSDRMGPAPGTSWGTDIFHAEITE